MVVPAGPSRDRHEAATWLLRWPGAFSRVLGGRASRRRSAKHGGEDRAEHFAGVGGRGLGSAGGVKSKPFYICSIPLRSGPGLRAGARPFPSGGQAVGRPGWPAYSPCPRPLAQVPETCARRADLPGTTPGRAPSPHNDPKIPPNAPL